jgi:putative peptidoglycan lipid II flippase
MLYVILSRRGHFRIELWLWGRIARQFIAGAAMAAALYGVLHLLGGFFSGSAGHRLIAVGLVIGVGLAIYFPLAWMIGGMDREDVLILFRKKQAEAEAE